MNNDSLGSNATSLLRNITHGIGMKGMTCVNEGIENDSH